MLVLVRRTTVRFRVGGDGLLGGIVRFTFGK